MWLERLQVQEGFLDGLDLEFSPGLNVLIGARGTGKTSIIELIRFCLGVKSFTEEVGRRSEHQAVSVLGSGQVTATLTDGQDRFVVSRSAADPAEVGITGVTVLAQNEIEVVGTHVASRRHVLDRYLPSVEGRPAQARHVLSQLKSTTTELRAALTEVDHLRQQLDSLKDVAPQLEAAAAEQAALMASIAATEEDRTRLASLQEVGTSLASGRVVIEKAFSNAEELRGGLVALPVQNAHIEPWPATSNESDPLETARQRLVDCVSSIRQAIQHADATLVEIESSAEDNRRLRAKVDDDARDLRVALNALQEGAGNITRRVDSLREQAGQVEALGALLQARLARVEEITARRDELYRQLDSMRDDRFAARSAIADRLNQELAPRIQVRLTRSAGQEDYVSAIVESLRGSGLHYNDLAPQLAASLAPLELVKLAETGAVAALAAIAQISEQRASAVVQQLQMADCASIVTSAIDDQVDFFLLDGTTYKSTAELSIGQRCAVVLPLLLSQHGDVLVVDQPEDHMDNAFIATTLVSSLRARHSTDQFIFSSHNANIPVLAEADRVILLDSDGRRGYIRAVGGLNDHPIVEAITSVMEGGADAFIRRAKFYQAGATIPAEWPNE
jgi:DNA repair exonuclease SbcCD ATPase subunit